jgi:hypothetical protein
MIRGKSQDGSDQAKAWFDSSRWQRIDFRRTHCTGEIMRLLPAFASLASAAAWSRAAVVSFQVGTDGYAGGRDNDIHQVEPDLVFGAAVSASIDANDGGGQTQALLAFDGIVGNAAGQIPPGATFTSATLRLQIDSAGSGINIHRMVSDWNEATITWNTADVQAWVSGTSNFGWAILPFVPNGTNGVDFLTREDAVVSTRPLLTVDDVVPEPTSLAVFAAGIGVPLTMRRRPRA